MFGVYPNCSMTVSKTLVWIGGDTYPVRADIKADGFKWSAKKKMWWMPIAEYEARLNQMSDGDDHAIMGTASDGTPVVVAECHHETIPFPEELQSGFNPWID